MQCGRASIHTIIATLHKPCISWHDPQNSSQATLQQRDEAAHTTFASRSSHSEPLRPHRKPAQVSPSVAQTSSSQLRNDPIGNGRSQTPPTNYLLRNFRRLSTFPRVWSTSIRHRAGMAAVLKWQPQQRLMSKDRRVGRANRDRLRRHLEIFFFFADGHWDADLVLTDGAATHGVALGDDAEPYARSPPFPARSKSLRPNE